MDVLALRLDHLKARGTYVATIKTWLQETQVNGRLVSRGDLHLFVAEGPTEAIDALLIQFETEPVDTNARGERCIDKFYDVVGREPRESALLKPGFTDMHLLNDTMLEKLVLEEWGVPKDWLTTARSTSRTKRFLAWKEQAKVARKQGRRRTAQVRDETKQKQREAKRQKTESAADDKKEDKTT
ncbi:hypothetical protein H257_05812 [Aphanomyces astaci]|uniref:Uncharacterized protein n=1 Tax=Aphanomyces astaci TaxID=112090 RepID=W4GQF4_APHAT|nr:hypothetical protein H257_05812 [Aphanomyces astaci]ETV81249.1 hypothetical protein H257_05812 [Aphanomyces astaci]|eukprot:XP_009829107.1 hypothetical protein H257_05812 [Aphanomyces astaci]